MGAYKSLIVSHRLVKAGKKRKCYHDTDHQLQKGESCLEVREGMKWKGYCLVCAKGMALNAEKVLTSLREQLNG